MNDEPMNKEELRDEINRCLAQGDVAGMIKTINDNTEIAGREENLEQISFAYNVSVLEAQAGLPMLLSKVKSIDELVERSTRLRFYLIRIDFDAADGCMTEIFDFISKKDVSVYELLSAIYLRTFHQPKMLGWMQEGIENGNIRVI